MEKWPISALFGHPFDRGSRLKLRPIADFRHQLCGFLLMAPQRNFDRNDPKVERRQIDFTPIPRSWSIYEGDHSGR
jgi:hypothetical protein